MSGRPGGRYSGGPHPGEKAIPSPGVVQVRVIGAAADVDAAAARLAAVFGDNWHRHSLSPAGHGESGHDALVGLLAVKAAPRRWLFGLTAEEWLHLASEGQDSEVAPCCGNIGELREYLQTLTTCQGEGEASIMVTATLEAYEAARSDHETVADPASFPLLHRVLAGLRDLRAQEERQGAEYRAFLAARESGDAG